MIAPLGAAGEGGSAVMLKTPSRIDSLATQGTRAYVSKLTGLEGGVQH